MPPHARKWKSSYTHSRRMLGLCEYTPNGGEVFRWKRWVFPRYYFARSLVLRYGDTYILNPDPECWHYVGPKNALAQFSGGDERYEAKNLHTHRIQSAGISLIPKKSENPVDSSQIKKTDEKPGRKHRGQIWCICLRCVFLYERYPCTRQPGNTVDYGALIQSQLTRSRST